VVGESLISLTAQLNFIHVKRTDLTEINFA
jgi:hypothetical protein